MLIDCEKCEMRDVGCADCVVSVMIGDSVRGRWIGEEERRALDVLADSGVVPPLRMTLSRERVS